MMLEEISTIAVGDLPLEALKSHLRMGSGFADDAIQDEVLESYLLASIAAVEARTGKMLFIRRLLWTLDNWAQSYAQPIPVAPVTAIVDVTIKNREGVATVADNTSYTLQRDTHRPKLVAVGAALPTIPEHGTAEVTFDGGFASTWDGVPADLRHATFLLAAHYYENRSETSGVAGLMPFGVMALLEPHRNVRVFGGGA